MNLFFFGTNERQLFGAYHAPAGDAAARGAALLCSPWGPEYFAAHRTLRQLATRLAASGFHVLRFDYYGTGDSAGERDEGDLASWVEDATMALEELQDVSGDSRISVFGMRLGAVVASRLARARASQVRTVALWDPVVDGQAYLREMQSAQREIDRWSLTPRSAATSPPAELLGTPLTPAMATSIERVTLDEFRELGSPRMRVFFSDEKPANQALCDVLRTAGMQLKTQTVAGQTPWREETLMQGLVPNVAVEWLVEAVG
jgi:uncharacterized protein